jgi:hypothetical protein
VLYTVGRPVREAQAPLQFQPSRTDDHAGGRLPVKGLLGYFQYI